MNTCAIQISSNCSGEVKKRGICSNCYKQLIAENLIEGNEKYPEWLMDLIRQQDTFDRQESRHPCLSMNELKGNESYTNI